MPNNSQDERAILNTLSEFPRVVDRNEWHRVGEVFAKDVCFNYGDGRDATWIMFSGESGVLFSPEA